MSDSEQDAVASVGQDESPPEEGVQALADLTRQLNELVQAMVEQEQVGVLELRAGEVEAWTRTVLALILEVMPALIRWDGLAALQDLAMGPRMNRKGDH
jgi:hypothetical protein